MGFFDELKKITRPYDEDYLEGYDDDSTERPYEDEPAETPPPPRSSSKFSHPDGSGRREARQSAITGPNRTVSSGNQSQVVLIKPERFETASEAADHLRDRRTVVLILEQTNKDVARRLIDFLSGVAYAMDGKIQKIAGSTYIITPKNVDLTGDIAEELENGGLYF